jgi:hypothetical protein
MKKWLSIILLTCAFFLSGCGISEVVDGAMGMKDTLPQLSTSIQSNNVEALNEATAQLKEQWNAISGLAETIAPEVHQNITEQLQVLESLSAAETFDQLQAQIAARSLNVVIEELISF